MLKKKKKKILKQRWKDTYLKHVKNSLPKWGLLQIDQSSSRFLGTSALSAYVYALIFVHLNLSESAFA